MSWDMEGRAVSCELDHRDAATEMCPHWGGVGGWEEMLFCALFQLSDFLPVSTLGWTCLVADGQKWNWKLPTDSLWSGWQTVSSTSCPPPWTPNSLHINFLMMSHLAMHYSSVCAAACEFSKNKCYGGVFVVSPDHRRCEVIRNEIWTKLGSHPSSPTFKMFASC